MPRTAIAVFSVHGLAQCTNVPSGFFGAEQQLSR